MSLSDRLADVDALDRIIDEQRRLTFRCTTCGVATAGCMARTFALVVEHRDHDFSVGDVGRN